MTVEATTPRASLESSALDSSQDNASSTTRTLINASTALLSNLSQQGSKEQETKQPKLRLQGCTHVELRRKLKSDLMAKFEMEAERNANGLTCSSISTQQHLCMKLLSNGKPNSFIEFFNLTHSESQQDTPEGSEVKKDKVKFHLGKVNIRMGACSDAITWFEDYLDFMRGSEDEEGLLMGSRQLLEVYGLSAKRAKQKGELQRSIELFKKSAQMADICGENRAKAEAKHQLGLLHQKLSEFQLALQYQMEFLEFCCGENDMVGQSKAHAAVAKTQESMGRTDIAIKHLEALLEVSELVNVETQAIACCKLGMLYNKQKLYDKAVVYFEMFFKLACALKDPKLMDAARLNLGCVRSITNMNEAVFSIRQVC